MVSIVVMARDTGAAAESTVLDLLRQQHRNIEVVFVDDGSTDDTAQRIAAIKDPRVTIFRRPWKSGPVAARKLGLLQANGQFIVFLDAGARLATNLAAAVAYLEGDVTANGVSATKGHAAGIVYRRAAVERAGGFDGQDATGNLDDALAARVTRVAVLAQTAPVPSRSLPVPSPIEPTKDVP